VELFATPLRIQMLFRFIPLETIATYSKAHAKKHAIVHALNATAIRNQTANIIENTGATATATHGKILGRFSVTAF
jgi:hypothetical protein